MRGQYSYTINSLETCSFYGKNQTESSDTYPNEFIPFNFLTRQRLTYHWKLGERRVWQMQLWAIQFETLNTAIRSIIILLRWLRSVRVVLMLIYMQCVLCWFQSPNMPCVVCVCASNEYYKNQLVNIYDHVRCAFIVLFGQKRTWITTHKCFPADW